MQIDNTAKAVLTLILMLEELKLSLKQIYLRIEMPNVKAGFW